MRDQRSPEAQAWRRLYNTAAWRRARQSQLRNRPLCERCQAKGFIVPATVVNHRQPHKGDWSRFIDPDNHQSLCAPCHDGPVQQGERSGKANDHVGYSNAIGPDGLPIDPRHPANAPR